MSANITTSLKKTIGDLLKINVVDDTTDNYYLAFGRSQAWNVPDSPPALVDSDVGTLDFQRNLRNSLQSYKLIGRVSYVVPRVTWTISTVYYPYDDNVQDQTNNYYVVNSANSVYVCLQHPTDPNGDPIASTVEPTITNTVASFKTSDDYVWRFLYTISPIDDVFFGTATYIPVKTVIEPTTPEDSDQLDVQNASVKGEILGIILDSSGSGFTSSPTLTLNGPGDSAAAGGSFNQLTAKFTNFLIDSDGSGRILHGFGYTDATFKVTGGGGSLAIGRPVIGPVKGINADPVDTLRATKLMLSVDVQDTESGTILAENDYRSIAIIRKPKKWNSDSDVIANAANAIKRLQLTGTPTAFTNDEVVTDLGSGAQGHVVYYDNVNKWIYYYQDRSTGFLPFIGGNGVQGDIAGFGTLNNPPGIAPDVDVFSGDILVIDNVATSISRNTAQTEEIKILIDLTTCS